MPVNGQLPFPTEGSDKSHTYSTNQNQHSHGAAITFSLPNWFRTADCSSGTEQRRFDILCWLRRVASIDVTGGVGEGVSLQ